MRFMILVLVTTMSATAVGQQQSNDAAGTTVRVAAVSFLPQKFDLAGNADRLESAFRAASKGGAKIAVAPEGALDGYVVNEIIASEVLAERMNEVAISIDDPLIQRFQRLAAELEMCLAFGFAERIQTDVFNCSVFIDQQGSICGKYHKMQFAEGYDPSWWFNRLGRSSRAFDTPYGRCGMMICNDRWNPQLARIPVLDGAQFLIIPAFGSRSASQDKAVLSRGQENEVPVIEANVGVTLVVNQGEIAAVDRDQEGVTFGEVTIPPTIRRELAQRDALEREFLAWRTKEMQIRWKRKRERLQQQAIDSLTKLGGRMARDDQGRIIEVNLQETKTSDSDLIYVARFTDLQELSLHQTELDGGGLAYLKGLKELQKLFLSDTRIGDTAVAHLSQLTQLKVLGLSGTNVSNAGLSHLKQLRQLESVFLIGTKATADGIEELQRALPNCDVTH